MTFSLSTTLTTTTAAAALLLASCAAGMAQSAPVTITLWQNSADTPAESDLYKAWEKKTGNKIELVPIASPSFIDTVMTKWGTGSHPDVLEWFSDGAFLAGLDPDDNLQPLDGMSFIKQSAGLYDNTGIWNGHTYAVLLHAPILYGMFYNKDVLDKAGIKPPTTYAELKADCATIKEKAPGVAPIFQAGGSSWPLTVLPFNLWGGHFDYGQKIAYNQATFGGDGSPFVDALKKFVELQDAGCYNSDITTATEEDSDRALVAGKAAFLFQNTAEIVGLQSAAGGADAADQKLGFGSVGEEKPYANFQSNPIGVYVLPKSGDAAKEAAAMDFIQFATTDYYQTYVNEAKTPPTVMLPGIQQPSGVSKLQLAVDEFYATAPKEPLFNSNIAGFGQFVDLMPQLAAKQIDPQQLADSLQNVVSQASVAAGVKGWQ